VNIYSFKLEMFHIDNTRSRHEDTDTVDFGLQIGTQQLPVQSFFAGDVNNGDHGVNLVFGSVLATDADTPVAISYEIYNGDASKLAIGLDSLAKKILTQVIDQTVKTSGVSDNGFPNLSSGEAGADIPQKENPFLDTSSWSTVFFESIFVGVGGFFFPDCDGFVAADGIGGRKRVWDKLIDASGGATLRTSMHYPGSDSPSGCGSNSDYSVTWSVTRERVTGSMRQFLKAHGLTLHPGLRSLSSSAITN
jgi:hypothetical protein